MTDSLIAIVPAAGVGQRAARAGESGPPKQYRLIAGQPMLRHAVQALLADARIAQVRVAVSANDGWAAEALAGLPRTVCRSCGGPTRAETVAAALADSGAADGDWVLVHDAARPGLPAEALARLIDACLSDAVGGLLALPVADTVKSQRRLDTGAARGQSAAEVSIPLGDSRPSEVDSTSAEPRVRATLDREGLWLAQTPQMFRAGLLRAALASAQSAGVAVTDEASAIEAAGYAPLLVPGSLRNFKVTWPDDFELMGKWV
ncbi:2-C-methyl-D-erythritol 4-phosphate cytidylyltransferase [Bordetella muralis]|jgi:2-C-methyl-D-erythritol 4-phosphate cytidylyltransferase|uniref:IspD/TarI family cytidylyltransferase n=1 Tax=Bordetella muralis TaxID=1649130 RepID=UPI0039EFA76E